MPDAHRKSSGPDQLKLAGQPLGNTRAKAGWSTLKTELLPHVGAFTSLEEARLEVAYYLDTYFSLDRHHSTLTYAYRFYLQFKCDFRINPS